MVSVIVPNYNHADFLKQRIDSVLQQSYCDFELIILDDCSTDNSKDIIDQYRHHNKVSHIIYNDVNGGSTFIQWDKGISLAKGKYIWLAESDDFASNDFLEYCMNEFSREKELVVVYTDSNVVDDKNQIAHEDLSFWTNDVSLKKWTTSYINNGREEIIEALSKKNTIPNASAVVFKKNFFHEILKFKFCGDWFFWIKVLEKNGRIAFIKRSLNYFRSHENTTRHSTYTPKKLARSLKERSIILFYLQKNNLIDPAFFLLKRKEIIADWKNIFRISDIFKRDFFVPANDPVIFSQLILYKLNNAFNRMKRVGKASTTGFQNNES